MLLIIINAKVFNINDMLVLCVTNIVVIACSLFVLVFPSVPDTPRLPCLGEDRNMYRRGAKKWRKYYRVNGHLFQAKRFSRVCFHDEHSVT